MGFAVWAYNKISCWIISLCIDHLDMYWWGWWAGTVETTTASSGSWASVIVSSGAAFSAKCSDIGATASEWAGRHEQPFAFVESYSCDCPGGWLNEIVSVSSNFDDDSWSAPTFCGWIFNENFTTDRQLREVMSFLVVVSFCLLGMAFFLFDRIYFATWLQMSIDGQSHIGWQKTLSLRVSTATEVVAKKRRWKGKRFPLLVVDWSSGRTSPGQSDQRSRSRTDNLARSTFTFPKK